MNTEINLLDKKVNKYAAPLFFGGVFIVGFIIVFGLIFFQQKSLNTTISQGQQAITDMEIIIAEHNQKYATKSRLNQVKSEVDFLTDEMTPHVDLYKDIIHTLPSPRQLIRYTITDDTSLTLDGSFKTLKGLSNFITKLDKKTFITETEIVQVNLSGNRYEATLTVKLDSDALIKEFDAE